VKLPGSEVLKPGNIVRTTDPAEAGERAVSMVAWERSVDREAPKVPALTGGSTTEVVVLGA
jgi:hypothetical protein